jgi:PAS domain S-box-containing protein
MITISREYATLYGLAPDRAALKYEEWLSLIHPDERDALQTCIEESIKRTGSWDTEFRVVWPDGSEHWLLGKGRVLLDDSGEPVRRVGVNFDITERKRAAELRSHLAAIVESSADAIVGVALDGKVVSWNSGAERVFGYKVEEMVGRPISLLAPSKSPDEILRGLERLRQGERIVPYETGRLRKDGRRIEVSVTISPIRDSTGRVIGAAGIARDITERKRAEASLRESEERFRATFFQAAVGIAQTGIDGQWLLVNDRLCEILGYSQAELSGKTFLDITHPDDLEANLVARRQFLQGEISSWSTEKRYIRKNGITVWARVFVSLVRGQDNQPQYFISVVEDITERVQAEQALRESEQRLSLAQSAAHMGVWHLDLATHEITFSADYARLYGLASDRRTLTHLEWLSMIHPDDRGRVQALIRETLEQSHIWDAEYRVIWPDGTVHWLLAKGTVFLDDSHRPSRSSGVVMDITDRKQAEAVVRRSLDEIAHLNRVAAMVELTGSLAHELNQPLAAILSNAQAANRFLNGKSPDLAQIRECLTDIVADDKRAGEVIKRVRALLKKEESGTAHVDLNEVVGDVIRLLQNDAMLRKTLLAFDPAPNLPIVRGDRVQLYQVMLNLILNGLEASGEQEQGDRWLKVRITEGGGGAVELTVEDSGKGIAASDLERVFEPFFTTKREGLGMGLSISRSIVQAHGGRVWAENSAEGGAIFRCVLPAAQQTAAAAQ